jgi:predicted house-cleaning noncanonical NTP pyrophosphatase (MazG superfamily)
VKKVFYNKLIRDRIPEKIKNKGSNLKTRVLGSKEFEQELLKKVGEEASSLPSVSNKKELLLELADVLAVIDEIKKIKKITTQDINKAKKKTLD